MTGSVHRKYGRLLGGGTLLLIGVGFIIYTFWSPMASTAVLCSDSMIHWDLFGIAVPIVRSIDVAPMKMQLSWHNGCNAKLTSLWIPLGGCSSFVLGSLITMSALRERWL